MDQFQYYKIKRTDLVVYVKYNTEDESTVQLMENSVVLSRGKLIGSEDSSKEEFDIMLQKFMKKLQNKLDLQWQF